MSGEVEPKPQPPKAEPTKEDDEDDDDDADIPDMDNFEGDNLVDDDSVCINSLPPLRIVLTPRIFRSALSLHPSSFPSRFVLSLSIALSINIV